MAMCSTQKLGRLEQVFALSSERDSENAAAAEAVSHMLVTQRSCTSTLCIVTG